MAHTPEGWRNTPRGATSFFLVERLDGSDAVSLIVSGLRSGSGVPFRLSGGAPLHGDFVHDTPSSKTLSSLILRIGGGCRWGSASSSLSPRPARHRVGETPAVGV